jgi:hypothetical protein
MIPIFIDTSSISEQFEFNQNDINSLMDYTVKEITHRFAQEWENEANRSLKSSRQEYISNIIVVDEGFAKGSVVLTGWLPNAIEQGMDSYDLKEGMLSGPKARMGKNGRYNIIPFSFGTPGALGENFTGGIMPSEIHQIVKSKPLVQNLGSRTISSRPLKENEIPKSFRAPVAKSVKMPESKSVKNYQHKTSIYQGIRKMKDKVTGQNSYGSFRVVSDVSDPASWIHPGFDATNLSQKALSNFDIPSEVGRIFDEWFSRR